MYEIGDYIVKSVDGVCRVKDILHLDLSGTDKNKLYYLLVPLNDEKGKIYMPTDTKANVRKVMSEEDAWKLIHRIPAIEEIWIDNEKLRERKYKEAVRSCNPEALIGIIKMTYLRRKERLEKEKKSTVVDERYFHLAENNLYSELGFALHKKKEDISRLITDVVNQKENSFDELQ